MVSTHCITFLILIWGIPDNSVYLNVIYNACLAKACVPAYPTSGKRTNTRLCLIPTGYAETQDVTSINRWGLWIPKAQALSGTGIV